MRLALAIALLATPAAAEGFAVDNLAAVTLPLNLFEGGAAVAGDRNDGRLSVLCDGCADMQALDVILGTSTDGTEARYRAGETTIAEMEALCRNNNDTCRMDALELGGAVGWRSSYALGGTTGATAVLFQDGDLLTVRAIGPDLDTTMGVLDRGLDMVASRIVGP